MQAFFSLAHRSLREQHTETGKDPSNHDLPHNQMTKSHPEPIVRHQLSDLDRCFHLDGFPEISALSDPPSHQSQ